MILVTGGAGFIGSHFVDYLREHTQEGIVVLDNLTYAGDARNIHKDVPLIQASITDAQAVGRVLRNNRISKVFHFAAETHVDRSIHSPLDFTTTNVLGTHVLLEECRKYWGYSTDTYFHHVSSDEVFGSLSPNDRASLEDDPYDPRSPYAASKAGSDYLVKSYMRTYDFPAIITYATNNYGSMQSLEKLIPLMIYLAIEGKPLPIYGDGKQVRDWLHVRDHCDAIYKLSLEGAVGECFNISANQPRTNLEVVSAILDRVDFHFSRGGKVSEINHVADRNAHDRRYDLDTTKIYRHHGWEAVIGFEEGIVNVVDWYVGHRDWILSRISSAEFDYWMEKNYKGRK